RTKMRPIHTKAGTIPISSTTACIATILRPPSFSFSSPFLVNKQGYAVHNRGTTFSPQRFPVKLSTHEVLFPFFHGTTPIKKEPARIRPGFPHFEAEIVPTHSPRNWGVRFSRKAFIPSLRSWVSKERPK